MQLIETLEIHHLANRDPHLHFALLTDWRDAPDGKHCRRTSRCCERARAGIEIAESQIRLPAGDDLFFLFHRPRRWNAERRPLDGLRTQARKADGVQRLSPRRLRANAFRRSSARPRFFRSIKYVITLDTDTQLPRESARQLVGTMAHPLNRPRFDPARGIVTEGYSLLQPRVDVSLPSASRSWFVRLHAGDAGHRSLHARGLGCVSGSFPGRLLHRQRNLRGRCLRARPGRALSGEHGF